jgi:phosphate-selective porin OprO/OprP
MDRDSARAVIEPLLRVIVWAFLLLAALPARAETNEPPAGFDASADIDSEKARRRKLKEPEIVVETNAPALPAAAAVPGEKSFVWSAAWEGWNGLNIELKRKTMLAQHSPSVTNAEDALTLRWLFFGETIPTNTFRLNIEEVRMGLNLGARFDVDGSAYYSGDNYPGLDNGFELRRARLIAKGDVVLVVPFSYQIEVGYVPDQFSLQDTFLVFRNIGFLGDLKMGQFQPPMGLEAISGSRFDPYMEYAAPIQALAPGSDAGIQLGRAIVHDRMTWHFGLFGDGLGQDVGDASQNFARAIMRVTGLPIYRFDPARPDSTKLLHLGLSANVVYSGDNVIHYQSRPESYRAPYVVNTGDIDADGALVVGGEAAWVNGPLTLQAEYLHSFVKESWSTNGAPTLGFDGFYASAGWFLTGESRPYDHQRGSFGRVIPRHNFNLKTGGGLGALELAARYSYVDLNSANINGGRMSILMTSLNWYLEPHVVLRFEYGFAHITEAQPSGNINIFQTRLQVDF